VSRKGSRNFLRGTISRSEVHFHPLGCARVGIRQGAKKKNSSKRRQVNMTKRVLPSAKPAPQDMGKNKRDQEEFQSKDIRGNIVRGRGICPSFLIKGLTRESLSTAKTNMPSNRNRVQRVSDESHADALRNARFFRPTFSTTQKKGAKMGSHIPAGGIQKIEILFDQGHQFADRGAGSRHSF